MFTGIVERVGRVLEIEHGRLAVDGGGEDYEAGESVAVNGCCLTAKRTGKSLDFDLSEETIQRTNLAALKPGDKVNLERAMRADGRFGGHFVQGHVDAVGALQEVQQTEQAHMMRFAFPRIFGRSIIEKGSIAVNGVSLTANEVGEDSFKAWIIPHTWERTNLSDLSVGVPVNLEFDMIAKYVERLVSLRP